MYMYISIIYVILDYDQVENPLQKQNALDGCTASHRAAEFNRYICGYT